MKTIRSGIKRFADTLMQVKHAGHITSVQSNCVNVSVASMVSNDTLEVAINGQKAAVAHVADLSQNLSLNAQNPIRILFPSELCDGDIIDVRFSRNRRVLAGSPWRFKKNYCADIPYTFLHVPKTAGTSLRVALEEVLGEEAIFPNRSYLRLNGGFYPRPKDLTQAMLGLPPTVKLMQGHLPFRVIKSSLPNTKIISVIREPVARVISLLQHKKKFISPEVSVSQLLESNPHLYSNQMVKMFSDVGLTGSGEDCLQSAIRNAQSIDVLGFTESYRTLLKACGSLLGVELGEPKRLNTSGGREPIDSATLEKIRDLNELDARFYRKMLEFKDG